MRTQYSPDNKIIIKCVSCLSMIRVPLDKGKISVICPVCRKEFIYDPDSIFHTLKQIIVSGRAYISKSKKNRNIFIGAASALLIILLIVIIVTF